MSELSKIANLIEQNEKRERREFTRNSAIAGGYVFVHGADTYRRLWITNHFSESNHDYVRDINGEIRDTVETRRRHTLKYTGEDVAVCKHIPIARAVIDGYGYDRLIGKINYDILQSYFWGETIRGKIRIGTVELNRWLSMTLAEMLATQRETISDEERTQLDLKLKELESRQKNVQMVVRERMQLRNNPILDMHQEEILLSHVFDGTAMVIDGGPGTGKTTTLIQRLKFLISPRLINERRQELGERLLNKRQIELLEDDDKNWIFFSPTNLLRNYLRSNMEYEGLRHTSVNTAVWNNYLRDTLRDNYLMFGKEYPFDYKKNLQGTKIFKKNSLSVVKNFTGFFLKKLVQRVGKVTTCQYNFTWRKAGILIIRTCEKIKDAHSLLDLVKGLMELENLKDVKFDDGAMSIPQVIEKYNSIAKVVGTNHLIRLKKNNELYTVVCELINSWAIKEDEDVEEEEESDVNMTAQENVDIEVRVNRSLRSLIRKLALCKIDPKIVIKGRQAELKSLVDSIISKDELDEFAPYAWFNANFYPVVRSLETFLLSVIPATYKEFRRAQLKQKKEADWYLTVLKQIVEGKSAKGKSNRALHPQEQALLLGFINNLILTIRKASRPRYDKLTHKYADAFRQCYRPIIGVDEATDYTIFDYYAISSLRHPEFSCVTLTGDIMQGLVENGITGWQQLKNGLIFPKLDVEELTVSYRQSPKLMSLAAHIYKNATGKNSPYTSTEEDSAAIPYPLWYRNDDEEEKGFWIIQRILELKRFYEGAMPSVAVFVDKKDTVQRLTEILKDEDGEAELEAAGIDVVDCSNELTDAAPDKVRIFPIEMVKGLEFQVVFFHDIEKIPNSKILDKYLYVGLSRATYHMAVTSGTELNEKTTAIAALFKSNGHW